MARPRTAKAKNPVARRKAAAYKGLTVRQIINLGPGNVTALEIRGAVLHHFAELVRNRTIKRDTGPDAKIHRKMQRELERLFGFNTHHIYLEFPFAHFKKLVKNLKMADDTLRTIIEEFNVNEKNKQKIIVIKTTVKHKQKRQIGAGNKTVTVGVRPVKDVSINIAEVRRGAAIAAPMTETERRFELAHPVKRQKKRPQ